MSERAKDNHDLAKTYVAEAKLVVENARALLDSGDAAAAEQEYRRVAADMERWERQGPEEFREVFRGWLAGAHHGIGFCLQAAGALKASLKYFETSESIRREIDRHSNVARETGIGVWRAMNLQVVAEVQSDLGPEHLGDALETYRRACGLYEREMRAGRLAESYVVRYARTVLDAATLIQESGTKQDGERSALSLLDRFCDLCESQQVSIGDVELAATIANLRQTIRDEMPTSAPGNEWSLPNCARRFCSKYGHTLALSGISLVCAIAAPSIAGSIVAVALLLCFSLYWLAIVKGDSAGFTRRYFTAVCGSSVVLGLLWATDWATAASLVAVLCTLLGSGVLAHFLLQTRFVKRWQEKHLLHVWRFREDHALASRTV